MAPGALTVFGKLIRHGQILLIYPSAFESREERLANYDFPSDLPYEDVDIVTSDRKTLKCILLRANRRSRLSTDSPSSADKGKGKAPRATVIMFHGNGYHIWHHAFSGSKFVELGCDVLLVSYRGYGHSQGTPSEKGLQKDSQAALEYVLAHPELSQRPIILHGHSLGGAVAIDLTHRNPHKITALIIENTFLSIPAVVQDIPGLRHLIIFIHQKWESHKRIRGIPGKTPILMFSGTDDEVVPAKQMKELWDIAQQRSRKVERRQGKGAGGWKRFLVRSGGGGDSEEKESEDGEDDGKDEERPNMDVFKSIPGGTHADTWVKPNYWSTIDTFLSKVTKSRL
ncbi:bem46 protein, variant [Paramarasmius palmivorus]|uniref:Bem46 protein, variant n=1 Tax=Paramarasmius palmivorus TaxID=297713 RepID=A0AAW0ARS1_9AGAR